MMKAKRCCQTIYPYERAVVDVQQLGCPPRHAVVIETDHDLAVIPGCVDHCSQIGFDVLQIDEHCAVVVRCDLVGDERATINH